MNFKVLGAVYEKYLVLGVDGLCVLRFQLEVTIEHHTENFLLARWPAQDFARR